MRAQDEYGVELPGRGEGLTARVIQHEIDHLDGVLMLDRISREARKEAMRAMREAQREPRAPPSGAAACRALRTVFLGTSEFAAAVLERLAREPHRPALVLTRPDRPRGRGRRLAAPPVAERGARAGDRARAARARRTTPRGRSSAIAQRRRRDARWCVCAFGALIKEPLLSAHELLNVHPSLLPRWRGAAPIERAIMAGDERTGVSIMRLTAGLDSGPVCLAAREPIDPRDTYGSLAARLARLGGELLVRALDEIEAGEPPPFAEQEEATA